MTRTAYPRVGGRTEDAQYSEFFDTIIGTGVRKPGELAVTADSTGLNVKVGPGFAVVSGNAFRSDATETLAIASNPGGNVRIDTVVLRRDFNSSGLIVDLVVKPGVAQASPVPPTLTQNVTGVWEEPLADIAVPGGAATITSAAVTPRHRLLSTRVQAFAQRPADRPGLFGLNLSTGTWEGFDGSQWRALNINDDRYYTKGQVDQAVASRDGAISDARSVAGDAWTRANNAQSTATDAKNGYGSGAWSPGLGGSGATRGNDGGSDGDWQRVGAVWTITGRILFGSSAAWGGGTAAVVNLPFNYNGSRVTGQGVFYQPNGTKYPVVLTPEPGNALAIRPVRQGDPDYLGTGFNLPAPAQSSELKFAIVGTQS